MYTPVLIVPVDRIGEDCERLPVGDVRELNIQFNCNHDDSEEMETWFDEVTYHEDNLTIVDDDYFFEVI